MGKPLFYSLWFVCNDWEWLIIFQVMYKVVIEACIIFVLMFQGVVKFVNDIHCILLCVKSYSRSFDLKMVAMVLFYHCSPYT